MTNESIIMNERIRLAKAGLIGYTGRVFCIDGKEFEEPEAIHTFAYWKSKGFSVKKGEHAITRLAIWKHTVKKAKSEDEEDESKMFMKMAHFFSSAQVEKAAE